ncbi:MAG: hypothetical protein MK137_08255 [Rickettsiales bacterium]|nr:hypothetical protein [Rickettsiales bacterium]
MSMFTTAGRISLISLIALLVCSIFYADNAYSDDVVKTCEVTDAIEASIDGPPSFKLTNNLRRISSKHELASGVPVIFRGVVTDSECVPLAGAVVRLWHADAEGDYGHLDNPDDYDSNFAGTGVTVTDNMGKYQFLTIKPGEYAAKPSVFHFEVMHESVGEIKTDIFIGGVEKAKRYHPSFSERILEKLVATSHPMYPYTDEEGYIYKYNFTIDGLDERRGF